MVSEIIKDYENFINQLNSDDSSYGIESAIDFMNIGTSAMEADMNPAQNKPTNTTDTQKEMAELNDDNPKSDTRSATNSEAKSAEEKGREFGEAVNKLFTALSEKIRDFMSKYTLMVSSMIQSDKKFKEIYSKAKINYKPTGGVKMTVYNYNVKVISNARSQFNAYVKKVSSEFLSGTIGEKLADDSIFEIEDSQFDATVLKSVGAPSNITTFSDYLKYLVERYQGQATTKIIQPSDASLYEDAAMDETKLIRATLNRDKNEAYNIISKLTTNLKLVRNNKGLTDETRNRAKKYATRLVRLEKMYNSYLDFYYQQRIKRTISARNILKTLFSL